MNCDRCGKPITDDVYHHLGQELCEDCYLDIVATPKTCDPWAVHTAKNLTKQKPILTPLQEKILQIINDRAPITMEEICKELRITETDFKTNFASLRHMELARAYKQGDRVCYVPFDANS